MSATFIRPLTALLTCLQFRRACHTAAHLLLRLLSDRAPLTHRCFAAAFGTCCNQLQADQVADQIGDMSRKGPSTLKSKTRKHGARVSKITPSRILLAEGGQIRGSLHEILACGVA